MEFYDGGQLFVEKVHIEGIPQPDHAKVTTRSDYIPQLDIIEMICIWESFFLTTKTFSNYIKLWIKLLLQPEVIR